MNPDLAAFLEHARSRGMDHGTIRMLLLAAGWKEKDVAQALAQHALELPVPAPPDSGGAREAFLHLMTFAALYAAAIAGVSLLFDCVNRLLPDPAFRQSAQDSAAALKELRWSLAVVLVSFPAYLGLAGHLLREMRKDPEKAWSAVRRWLTYLTLFVAAVALTVDFITLVFYFLEGELSLRFLVKVAIVGGVAGLALAYHLGTVRMPARVLAQSRAHRRFGLAACALAAVTLAWGSAVVGWPASERLRKLDERRAEDLRAIEGAIERLCLGPPELRLKEGPRALVHPLPASLDALTAAAVEERPATSDAASGAPYEYRVTGPSSFEVCATFDRARDEPYDVGWNHGSGRDCFTFDLLNPK